MDQECTGFVARFGRVHSTMGPDDIDPRLTANYRTTTL
jgi:hypothetical protein